MTDQILKPRTVEEILRHRTDAVSPDAVAAVEPIVREVRSGGEAAVRRRAQAFGELESDDVLVLDREVLDAALQSLAPDARTRLLRVTRRIREFAQAQRKALETASVTVPGGRAGHSIAAVERVGCYAPGGRYPLPSSVLMAVITARVAGVDTVWVASPKPKQITLAAAAAAGADGLLAAGGAHAVAALAYGAGPVPACDVLVGPGNKYVTAAKFLVSAHVRIDQFAGPSELVVVADGSADAALIAADLLAQAEHDPDALPILVSLDAALIDAVNGELAQQLSDLPTDEVARAALRNGGAVLASSPEEAVQACDRLAPEHVEVLTENADSFASRLRHFGAVFIGSGAGEVLGDYGAGPNHVLPTGGSARNSGGLSVFTFLRVRTWLEIDNLDDAVEMVNDAAWLGRLEGLEAHARSAERRSSETAAIRKPSP